ncbi:small subunit ribosomal protein S1 [Herbinix hemicellulosilytica]|uniref:S1 motif domain-containing protein n=1 Tax=Herbinix hemicellulosilytica TaxID=1564487 RepID=A0A0H5SJP4_HERHM|nr:S1 RNA-binding domain-containing protein [Herbinix hemicellulosilytica]RBP57879.1 small subunit ribosomal protein S1 [Herbinix hemicellulosilytica]CRZ35727.1 hypothetical protein HHT355_2544 [Herbinix hemicellulosilytica]
MSDELKKYDENNQMEAVPDTMVTEQAEPIPSMDDFKDLIDKSFRKISEGDIIKGIVIGKSDTEVNVDLGYYTEGVIRLEELSNDPTFSIKEDIMVGEEISAMVLSTDDGNGNILLSKKRADEILAWDKIYEDFENRSIVRVKIVQAVNGGVVAYLYGVRAFIPASQLTLSFIENLESWVGKEIEAVIVTALKENRKLVLSGKEVEIQKAETEKANKISKLVRGTVTTGTVEKIMPYGAFVSIGEGLSGLLHISQISEKRIKSPNEVIKAGDTVTVKIIDIKDGKISLSMKDVEDKDAVVEDVEDMPVSYSTGGEATTDLASLLKNIKL